MRTTPALAALAALAILAAPSARAAESYDGCIGVISSLPATISSQGVWCLTEDLSTSIASGAAITVAVNNVTIDCNGFKLGGLAAGPASMAVGILADGRLNTTVRGCNVRGFFIGVRLYQGGGHLVEDNRVEGSLNVGIQSVGTSGMVRRNSVTDTGQPALPTYAIGIWTEASTDVVDNTVDGVVTTSAGSDAVGIYSQHSNDALIAGNRIRGLVPGASGTTFGISNFDSGRVQVRDNHLYGTLVTDSIGISCASAFGTAAGNMVSGFDLAVSTCQGVGNIVNAN